MLTGLGLGLWSWSSHTPSSRTQEADWARKVLDDSRTGHEVATSVVANGDGVVVIGSTGSRHPSGNTLWALGLDGTGRLLWESTYDSEHESYGRAITRAPGGDLVVVGERQPDPRVRAYEGWALVLGSDGALRTEVTGGPSGNTGLTSVAVATDGSVLLGGVRSGHGWLLGVDPGLSTRWEQQPDDLVGVTAVCTLPAGGFAAVGAQERSTVRLGHGRILAIDADGRRRWDTRLPREGDGELLAVASLADGDLVVVGRAEGPEGQSLYVARVSAAGAILWEQRLGGDHYEAGRAIVVLPDGDLVVAGDELRDGRDRNVKVWRLDGEGRPRWERRFGGPGEDTARGIAAMADGGVVVVGSTAPADAQKTDLWVLRLRGDGDLDWDRTFGAR